MNLSKKKKLAARTLKVGKDRIVFLAPRIDEIEGALTKQDIRGLEKEGAISIKGVKGRKKRKRKKLRPKKRGPGKIRKKVKQRKKEYVLLTRKLRDYVAEMKKQGRLSKDEATGIRKKIRNREFRSKTHLKEYVGGLKNK